MQSCNKVQNAREDKGDQLQKLALKKQAIQLDTLIQAQIIVAMRGHTLRAREVKMTLMMEVILLIMSSMTIVKTTAKRKKSKEELPKK